MEVVRTWACPSYHPFYLCYHRHRCLEDRLVHQGQTDSAPADGVSFVIDATEAWRVVTIFPFHSQYRLSLRSVDQDDYEVRGTVMGVGGGRTDDCEMA